MKLADHPWPNSTDFDPLTNDAKPRCEATDPTCGPDPYRSEHACYDPSAPRILLEIPNDDGNTRERCAHDGECVRTACATCTHYSTALGVSCAKVGYGYFEGNEDALCGCLDGGCWFFRN
jgi:hypothetical protein